MKILDKVLRRLRRFEVKHPYNFGHKPFTVDGAEVQWLRAEYEEAGGKPRKVRDRGFYRTHKLFGICPVRLWLDVYDVDSIWPPVEVPCKIRQDGDVLSCLINGWVAIRSNTSRVSGGRVWFAHVGVKLVVEDR